MRSLTRAWASVVIGCAACSCSSAPDAGTGACGVPVLREGSLGASSSAITRGSLGTQLGLSAAERNAVVMIKVRGDAEEGDVVCSGVLVRRDWVVTARHCLEGALHAQARVTFGERELAPSFETASVGVRLHPSADVAAIELAAAPPSTLATPLSVLGEPAGLETLGLAVIAGYGLTHELELGVRAFAAVDVTAMDPQFFVTSGAPFSGACLGDSGGPLLARDPAGYVVVLGVLSSGSGSCRGADHFTRLGHTLDTLGLPAEAARSDQPGCDGLDAAGACYSSSLALWCDSGTLRREACGGGHTCGWSQSAPGYRCLAPGVETDPCEGASSFGTCDGGVAIRCHEGRLIQHDCEGCLLACARDPLDGRVGCSAVDPTTG